MRQKREERQEREYTMLEARDFVHEIRHLRDGRRYTKLTMIVQTCTIGEIRGSYI